MKTNSFKDLIVWQRGMEVARAVYEITDTFPSKEQYGLVSQMRRSAVSIPSNIAEGHRRGTQKDFLQFLRIADGSAAELETQAILAEELYPKSSAWAKFRSLLSEVQRMLGAMQKKFSK